jgi:uncharacterized protein with PIN domain
MNKTSRGVNIHAEPITACHAALRRASVDSDYRSVCPACNAGILPVTRDPKTLSLSNVDRCMHCGQIVVYTDRTICGEEVVTAKLPVGP